MNKDDLKKVYMNTCDNLEKSRAEYLSDGGSDDRREFYQLKYMISIILNDLAREYYNFEANPTIETSNLTALGPLVLTVYEAHMWYRKKGNRKLLEMAEHRGITQEVTDMVRDLKGLKSSRIEEYRNLRDKMSGHYEPECFDLIEELSCGKANSFRQDALPVLQYVKGWSDILGFIVKTTKD